ncbi:MAG: NPXTG-anchored protein [Oscillospiraceae bacterium]
MKIKRIFAGMAASAIAMSAFAMTSTVSASAEPAVYNSGITFQTNTTWNFRDLPGTDGVNVFPAASVGVQGGGYGNGSVEVSDTQIQYDGTYTISIATSGTIFEANTDKAGNEKGFTIDEEKGLTRMNSPWSMLRAYEAKETEEDVEVTQDTIEWVEGAVTDKFNMLCIATDIPCEYNDEDKPVVNGNVVEVSDIVVDMCGTEYTAVGDVYYKSDIDTVAVSLINTYGDSTIDAAALPADDGTITVTFTIKGLAEAPAEESSAAEESKADSSSAASTNSTSNGGSTTSKSSGGSTTTSKAAAGTTTSKAASDATESTETGAAAGIALALAAVAGAAVVVSRKK